MRNMAVVLFLKKIWNWEDLLPKIGKQTLFFVCKLLFIYFCLVKQKPVANLILIQNKEKPAFAHTVIVLSKELEESTSKLYMQEWKSDINILFLQSSGFSFFIYIIYYFLKGNVRNF